MLTIAGHKRAVRAVCYTPDGGRLLSAGADGFVRVRDAAAGFREVMAPRPSRKGIIALTVTADGRTAGFAHDKAGTGHGCAGTIDLTTGESRWVPEPRWPTEQVYAAAVTPDGRWLVAAVREGLWQWRLATGRHQDQYPSPDRAFAQWAVAVAADGRLAAGCLYGGIAIWPPPGPDGYAAPAASRAWDFGIDGTVRSLAFSPDGRLLAGVTGTENFRRVSVWDAATRQKLAEHPGRTVWEAVAFAPDGQRVVTVGREGTARVWEVPTLRERERFDWGVERLGCVAWSPDGSSVAAGGHDGTVVVWDAG